MKENHKKSKEAEGGVLQVKKSSGGKGEGWFHMSRNIVRSQGLVGYG